MNTTEPIARLRTTLFFGNHLARRAAPPFSCAALLCLSALFLFSCKTNDERQDMPVEPIEDGPSDEWVEPINTATKKYKLQMLTMRRRK